MGVGIVLSRIIKYRKGGALLSWIQKIRHHSYTHKRMSSCFFERLKKEVKASMTVEACFVLPFFLFALLNLISIVEIYRLQGNLSSAMHHTVKQMAIYGYEYRVLRSETSTIESLGLTYLYAADQVGKLLGEDYLENSLLADKGHSIVWLRSSVMKEDDCIDLVAEYSIEAPIAVVGFHEMGMYNRLRTRAWTGYDNAKAQDNSELQEQVVYITPEGTVYHSSRVCTYLKLSIMAVDIGFLESGRNGNGEKYYPCEKCGKNDTSTIYITIYGNRYHSSLSCSKLKRTILAVPISQVGERGSCSKCQV